MSAPPAIYCAFCAKLSHDAAVIVAGPVAHICDECVDRCTAIVASKRRGESDAAAIASAEAVALAPGPELTIPETPEGLLRQVLAEVRELRAEVAELREGVPPRPKGDYFLVRPLREGATARWVKRGLTEPHAKPQGEG